MSSLHPSHPLPTQIEVHADHGVDAVDHLIGGRRA